MWGFQSVYFANSETTIKRILKISANALIKLLGMEVNNCCHSAICVATLMGHTAALSDMNGHGVMSPFISIFMPIETVKIAPKRNMPISTVTTMYGYCLFRANMDCIVTPSLKHYKIIYLVSKTTFRWLLNLCQISTRLVRDNLALDGGDGRIRTSGGVTPTPHFECGAFNRSATSP